MFPFINMFPCLSPQPVACQRLSSGRPLTSRPVWQIRGGGRGAPRRVGEEPGPGRGGDGGERLGQDGGGQAGPPVRGRGHPRHVAAGQPAAPAVQPHSRG